MKAVLMSIQPKWRELIASGEKTVEVRKNRPKLKTPFKVYIYCTKDNSFAEKTLRGFDDNGKAIYYKANKGKVIGEFVCDRITPLYNICYDEWERLLGGLHEMEKELVGKACLTEKELHDYANGKRCYAWHISDLVIYDKPRELGEFVKYRTDWGFRAGIGALTGLDCNEYITIPPQSWCYVEEVER